MAQHQADILFDHARIAGENIVLPILGGIPMVWCPAGEFNMGVPQGTALDGKVIPFGKPHHVKLTLGYWIATKPFTNQQYHQITGKNSPFTVTERIGPNGPACGPAWITCREICGKLSHMLQDSGFLHGSERIDLPTSAQWEYACRAGTTTLWFWGNDPSLADQYVWKRNNSKDTFPDVGLKQPNPWGLYDLYCFVEEWCLDDIGNWDEHTLVDPLYLKHGETYKKVRGGNFGGDIKRCFSASSRMSSPQDDDLTGFRLVCVSQPVPELPDVITLRGHFDYD